jgi:hypothetical protein
MEPEDVFKTIHHRSLSLSQMKSISISNFPYACYLILSYLIRLMIYGEEYKWRRPSWEFCQTGSKTYFRKTSDYMMQSELILYLSGPSLLCLIHSKQQNCFTWYFWTRQSPCFPYVHYGTLLHYVQFLNLPEEDIWTYEGGSSRRLDRNRMGWR